MFFFANKLRLAFKPRRDELPPWAATQPTKEAPTPTMQAQPKRQYSFPVNHPGHGVYRFNELTGYPPELHDEINDTLSELAGTPMDHLAHVNDRAQLNDRSHGVHLSDIPNINSSFPAPEHGFRPVEVEHNGKRLTKLLMRGPYDGVDEVALPIDITSYVPTVNTIFRNDKNDKHKTLDLQRVHLPEEFQARQTPRRRLLTQDEVRAPGYRPIQHTDADAVNQVRQMFGKTMKPPTQ